MNRLYEDKATKGLYNFSTQMIKDFRKVQKVFKQTPKEATLEDLVDDYDMYSNKEPDLPKPELPKPGKKDKGKDGFIPPAKEDAKLELAVSFLILIIISYVKDKKPAIAERLTNLFLLSNKVHNVSKAF